MFDPSNWSPLADVQYVIPFKFLIPYGYMYAKFMTPDQLYWYEDLNKPSWIVYEEDDLKYELFLYLASIAAGCGAFRIWRDYGFDMKTHGIGLIAFLMQTVLKWMHYPIYMGCRSLKWGLRVISLATLLSLGAAIDFNRNEPVSSGLMLPYIVILLYDTGLSYYLASNNDNDGTLVPRKTKRA